MQILFRISQSNDKKGNPKNPDLDFLIEIHPEDGFRVRLGNPDLDFENLNPDFPIECTLSHINKTKPKNVCPSTCFGWIRDKKLELNNQNILDTIVIRSSINSQMLDSQSESNFDTKTGYTFNKTDASVQLGTS